MATIERFLTPISAASPSGIDPDRDAKLAKQLADIKLFAEGRAADLGENARRSGSVESDRLFKPEWPKVLAECEKFLGQSRHLRVALFFTAARLRLGGIAGLIEGLELIHGLLEVLWADLYPSLDPSDPNPAYERLGLLANLSLNTGGGASAGDPYGFVWQLRRTPILGDITYDDCESGRIKSPQPGAGDAGVSGEPKKNERVEREDAELSRAALRKAADAAPDRAAAVRALLDGAVEGLGKINVLLKSRPEILKTAPSASADDLESWEPVDFSQLRNTLLRQKEFLVGKTTAAAPADSVAEAPGSGAAESKRIASLPGTSVRGSGVVGSISSREDVIRILREICRYYRVAEPSSPVPLLLERAERLVGKPFMEVLADLAEEGLPQARKATGVAEEPKQE